MSASTEKPRPLPVSRLRELIISQRNWYVNGEEPTYRDAKDTVLAIEEYLELMEGPAVT